MKKNLIFRILGIVGGCLLAVSVFVPFISIFGMTSSLFENAEANNYVPYILLVFSFIYILVFVINKKIELAYLSIGASLTVAIMYTISNSNNFEYLSYGYYLLVFSPILMLIALLLLQFNNKLSSKIEENNSINNEYKPINNDLDTLSNINNMQFQPNELAQSIMDQPVMRDLSNNNKENEELSHIQSKSFESISDTNDDLNNVSNDSIDNKQDQQSILSIMDQPMINSQDLNTNFSNQNPLEAKSLSSIIDKTPIQPQVRPIMGEPVAQPQVRPIIEEPMVQPQVRSIMEEPVVQPQVRPIIEEPMVQPQVRPIIEEPMVQPQVRSIMGESVVQPQVRPIIEEPMMQPQVRPVMEEPMVQSKVRSIMEEPVVQPQVRPVMEEPMVQSQVRSIMEEPMMQPQVRSIMEEPVEQPQVRPVMEESVVQPQVRPIMGEPVVQPQVRPMNSVMDQLDRNVGQANSSIFNQKPIDYGQNNNNI